jgi:hypothetical protein
VRADILSLVSTLAAGQSNALTVSAFYDDAMTALARAGWFIEAELVHIDAGQAVSDPPVGTVRIVGLCYDDRDLAPTNWRAFESVSAAWRDMEGTPYAYTQESETTETFRLVPAPRIPSKAFSFIHGTPLGVDFPAYCVCAFVSRAPVDIPRWMDLPIAFGILAREFGYESAHADPAFAAACAQFGQLLAGAVSVDAS